MKIVAIIQARMGSSRLPGKVMLPICGRKVLSHVIERVSRCRRLDDVIVATTTHSRDDVIARETERCGAGAFRGPESDVLARYVDAARSCDADVVVRIRADCPLYDWQVLDAMLEEFEAAGANAPDYFANNLTRTFPRGLDTEIVSVRALERARDCATRACEREHVTQFVREHPLWFTHGEFHAPVDHSNLRWTLDTHADLRFIRKVFANLYLHNPRFVSADVHRLLQTLPNLAALNAMVDQRDYRLSA